MNEQIALTGHKNFPDWTARATLQVRPANDVVVENPSTLKHLLLLSTFANALYQLVNALERVVNLFIARTY